MLANWALECPRMGTIHQYAVAKLQLFFEISKFYTEKNRKNTVQKHRCAKKIFEEKTYTPPLVFGKAREYWAERVVEDSVEWRFFSICGRLAPICGY